MEEGWSGGIGEAMSRAVNIYHKHYEKDEYDEDGNLVAKAGDYWLKGGER